MAVMVSAAGVGGAGRIGALGGDPKKITRSAGEVGWTRSSMKGGPCSGAGSSWPAWSSRTGRSVTSPSATRAAAGADSVTSRASARGSHSAVRIPRIVAIVKPRPVGVWMRSIWNWYEAGSPLTSRKTSGWVMAMIIPLLSRSSARSTVSGPSSGRSMARSAPEPLSASSRQRVPFRIQRSCAPVGMPPVIRRKTGIVLA
ncbi:hypothetical protein HRbin27_01629 [bacterium HR27]|nr:hypothetical protein HRbin27_01629 [bacterium HR27]